MVKFIAHRANTEGRDPSNENKIDYILHALNLNYGVELDVLEYNDKLYLGHDEPQEELPLELLFKPDVFVHVKNLTALEKLIKFNCNAFWHQKDSVTLTNHGYIWCYPGVYVDSFKAVWVEFPDKLLPKKIKNIYGICSDEYKKDYFK